MAGVFISYTRADRALAWRVTRALRALDVEVIWDADMPSTNWQVWIERSITSLAAVVVLWSPRVPDEGAVRDEARLGLTRKKLVNLMVELPEPPFPFERINGIPLDGWEGRAPHSGWKQTITSLDNLLAEAGTVKAGALKAALTRQDTKFREKEAGIVAAARILAQAERAAEAARNVQDRARTATSDAGTQVESLAGLRVSTGVRAAAQREQEEAAALLCDATADSGRAMVAVEEALCKLDTLKAEFESWSIDCGAEGEPIRPSDRRKTSSPRSTASVTAISNTVEPSGREEQWASPPIAPPILTVPSEPAAVESTAAENEPVAPEPPIESVPPAAPKWTIWVIGAIALLTLIALVQFRFWAPGGNTATPVADAQLEALANAAAIETTADVNNGGKPPVAAEPVVPVWLEGTWGKDGKCDLMTSLGATTDAKLGVVVRSAGTRDAKSKETIIARDKSEAGVQSLETDQAFYVLTVDPDSRRNEVRVKPKNDVFPPYTLKAGC